MAKTTSTILLLVFAAVNLSLVLIRVTRKTAPYDGPRYPLFLPLIGTFVCLGFVLFNFALALLT